MKKNSVSQRTIKVKIDLSEEQKNALSITMSDAKEIFLLFVELCITHKSTSYIKLHKFGYEQAKQLCPNMPTALIQSVAKNACASVKSFNSNNPKRKWQFKGSKKSMNLPLNKLCLSRRGDLTSISTNQGRIRILHSIPSYFIEKYSISNTNNIQAGFVFVQKNKWYLAISYKIELPNIQHGEIIGLDRGLYSLVTTSQGMSYSSKQIHSTKRNYQYMRSKLQQKGTRSAKRLLRKRAGREKRFMRDVNHCITSQLTSQSQVGTFVLEKLTGIRKNRKGRKLNSWLSNWSFFQFEVFLEYKAQEKGIGIAYIDPRYTSQKCNNCGMVKKSNRYKNKYTCSCGYQEHADINAAKNIRDNYAISRNMDRAFQ